MRAAAAYGVGRVPLISVRRLGHATLTTPDIERQIAYYTEVVGLTLVERNKDRAYLACKLGLEAIALEPGCGNALSRLAFQVAPDSDLGEVERTLSKDNVKCERRSGISPGVAEAIVFTDPKGTLVEIFAAYQFTPDDGRSAGVMPLKLGHVAYRVDDVQKTVKFYCDVLGFRVSDWHADNFAFLRCNTDHHTVNFVYDTEPQLHHIAFEVKDWAEIQRAAEILARHDIRLVWGPGRHIIGHNIAIYHRNADKVRVEFFCEMDQMKDETLDYFDPRPWHQDRPQRPKVWPEGTLRNYWGFGSEAVIRGYQTIE
jgi:catechol 2,3-dioxygenase-like lactoylglutathione lyase family enzyme